MCKSSSGVKGSEGGKVALRCVQRLLAPTPNTQVIERRKGTARCMNAHPVLRSLVCSQRDFGIVAPGWWNLTVYSL